MKKRRRGRGEKEEEEEAALVDIHLVRHFYPLRAAARRCRYTRVREGAAFAGNDSMFLPPSPQPGARSLPPPSIPHNERSRNAGGQCSRKADSGIAVWPGTVHRSPSPLHLLHPRERTSPHAPSSSSITLPRAPRRFSPRPTAAAAAASPPPAPPATLLCLHLAPAAAGLSPSRAGCASIPDLTLLRR